MTAIEVLAAAIAEGAARIDRPLIVALDGRSGAGKSTLAEALRSDPPVPSADPPVPALSVIDGDDFYAGGSPASWDAMSARRKVDHCIDWRRQRPILDRLRRGRSARWRPFDWEAFDGRLTDELECRPSPVVILEGAYSARPELADLLDLRVLLDTPGDVRRQRLLAREGQDHADDLFGRWAAAEELYFGSLMPPGAFDLVLR